MNRDKSRFVPNPSLFGVLLTTLFGRVPLIGGTFIMALKVYTSALMRWYILYLYYPIGKILPRTISRVN